MRTIWSLGRGGAAVMLAVSFLFTSTYAIAGVTGGLAGVVTDATTRAPIAGAMVTARSPSQTATTTTDAGGHFVFLTLAPDTYTVRVEKSGYQGVAQSGFTVLADQTQQVTLAMQPALKVIATARTVASALVKPGVGGDLYNVTPSQQQASVALGGGGNMANAYSAISAVPGVMVPTGGAGWQQMVVIHGQNPYSVGYEYDGVPVNRAFDNYTSSTFSSLGLQELQVYTGGGPVSVASSGISGFINQVIKSGTYPGYASLAGVVGTEAFYHEAKFEAGGATPDRNFSYYVGLSGYNQWYRYVSNQMGAAQFAPGGPFAYYEDSNLFQYFNSADYGYGVTSLCTTTTGPNSAILLGGTPWNPASHYFGCLMNGEPSLVGNSFSWISDREDVINLHFGIQRRDGQRDDIQALWSASSLLTSTYTSPSDQWGYTRMALIESGVPYNPNPNSFFGNTACAPYCANYPYYNDATMYNLPFGTVVNPGTGVAGTPYGYYYFPDSPTNRGFLGQLPLNQQDPEWNDVGILKLQWTHPFSDSAYVRVYAYSMYSDWNLIGANTTYGDSFGPIFPDAEDYLLTTHTGGGEIVLADQINDENLLQLTGNYVTATTSRWYNTGFISGSTCSPLIGGGPPQACTSPSEIGLVSQSGGRYTCWNPTTMTATPCEPALDTGTGGEEFNTPYDNATGVLSDGVTPIPATSGAALAAGAQWETLWNTNAAASDNTVTPQFYNVNLSEEFRPSDRWVIDLAGRYDNYNYLLTNTANPQNEFYAQILQDLSCVNPVSDTPALTPLAPGQLPPPSLAYYQTCPTGYVHPDGVGGHPLFTDASPPNYDISYWSGRFSATYNSDPSTVWRISAGRYIEPPFTASVQYVNSSGNNLGQWGTFMQFGFFSPFHAIPAQSSAQYDFSWEHHFAGSNVSVKITPFYSYSSNWQQDYFIGPGYVTDIPVGNFRSYGVEGEIQAGDFAANGFSGLLSFAYTNAAVRYRSLMGESSVLQLDTAIEAYDCYTKSYYSANAAFCNKTFPQLALSGGASDCYIASASPSGASADPGCPNPSDITNPYYNQAPQPIMDPNGWWPDPATAGSGLFLGAAYNDAAGFSVPYTATFILNYRINKFAITPSIQYMSGSKYGSPMDFPGVDPVACAATGVNQGTTGVATTNNPQNCDYTTYFGGSTSPWGTLFVPDPQTGTFANFGQYTEPGIVLANLQLSYDVSPKVRLVVTAADLAWTCFGGSNEPWTKAYPPGYYVCGYDVNTVNYVGGLNGAGAYVGASPNDVAANGVRPAPWELQSYVPQPFAAGSFNAYWPVNIFVQAQIHI